VTLDGVANAALRRHHAHDEAIGEERHLVDGVVVGGIGHRQRQAALGIDVERHDAELRRHVRGHHRQHLERDRHEAMIGHARDHEPRLVEVGERVLVEEAEPEQALAERAAVALTQSRRRRQIRRPQDPRTEEEGTGHVGHCLLIV
jgi:hypothetical protein